MRYFPEQVFIGLQEVPYEISLIIPIAGCGHKCKGCHSPELQDANNGVELTEDIYLGLLRKYKDKVSCICFFGGEFEIEEYLEIAQKRNFVTAMYSGYDKMQDIPWGVLNKVDYLKIGSYNEKLGGLASKITNQRMWMITSDKIHTNITHEFWQLGEGA